MQRATKMGNARLFLLRGDGCTAPAGGDLNGDGKVGVADVIRLLKYIAEQK
ncbi:MAG: hypothetical protein IJS44_03660 [Clostridia bacterium]|nr:hypothetical protein [Clostridia bacterium]